MNILNIGAGSFNVEELSGMGAIPTDIVKKDDLEYDWCYNLDPAYSVKNFDFVVDEDTYIGKKFEEFATHTNRKFDIVLSYRFFEHVPFENLFYNVYLLSTLMRKDAIGYIVVPNYILLCKMLENMENSIMNVTEFQHHLLTITYEMLADEKFPHASIWTPKLAKFYLESEGYFKIERYDEKISFMNRDIYMGIKFVKV